MLGRDREFNTENQVDGVDDCVVGGDVGVGVDGDVGDGVDDEDKDNEDS